MRIHSLVHVDNALSSIQGGDASLPESEKTRLRALLQNLYADGWYDHRDVIRANISFLSGICAIVISLFLMISGIIRKHRNSEPVKEVIEKFENRQKETGDSGIDFETLKIPLVKAVFAGSEIISTHFRIGNLPDSVIGSFSYSLQNMVSKHLGQDGDGSVSSNFLNFAVGERFSIWITFPIFKNSHSS